MLQEETTRSWWTARHAAASPSVGAASRVGSGPPPAPPKKTTGRKRESCFKKKKERATTKQPPETVSFSRELFTWIVAPLHREVGPGLHACYWSVSKMASKWGMGCKQGKPGCVNTKRGIQAASGVTLTRHRGYERLEWLSALGVLWRYFHR